MRGGTLCWRGREGKQIPPKIGRQHCKEKHISATRPSNFFRSRANVTPAHVRSGAHQCGLRWTGCLAGVKRVDVRWCRLECGGSGCVCAFLGVVNVHISPCSQRSPTHTQPSCGKEPSARDEDSNQKSYQREAAISYPQIVFGTDMDRKKGTRKEVSRPQTPISPFARFGTTEGPNVEQEKRGRQQARTTDTSHAPDTDASRKFDTMSDWVIDLGLLGPVVTKTWMRNRPPSESTKPNCAVRRYPAI